MAMTGLRKIEGYPADYWFFDSWDIYFWCKRNNIRAEHMYSGPDGNTLRIRESDTEGQIVFLLTWVDKLAAA
jgi:hypothetical protein